MDLNYKLKHWENGQTQAERLAADILCLDGFTSVDPQCPLGGPDGIKDALCEKNGWLYVGAAYFPHGDKEHKDIKNKFLGDLAGVKKNKAQGLVFVTNQSLTPSQRTELITIAAKENSKAIVIHFERMRVLLNTPAGYGLRLHYLDIAMSIEEQLSFFSQWNSSFANVMAENTKAIIGEISHKIDLLMKPTQKLEGQVQQLIETTQRIAGEIIAPSDKSALPIPVGVRASDQINVEYLCLLHKALLLEYKYTPDLGILRKTDVWIGKSNSTKKTASFVPMEAQNIEAALKSLLESWSSQYKSLSTSGKKQKVIDGLAKFHYEFLKIHPFVDGNGRLARFLLMQQANELLDFTGRIVIEDSPSYFMALKHAEQGDYGLLKAILTQSIYGVEEVSD